MNMFLVLSRIVNWFKKPKVKNIIIAILFCLLCFTLYGLVTTGRMNRFLSDRIQDSMETINYYIDSLKQYEDVNGRLVSEKQLIEHNYSVLETLYSDICDEYNAVLKENRKKTAADKKDPLLITKVDLTVDKETDVNSNADVTYSEQDSVYNIAYSDSNAYLNARLYTGTIPKFILDKLTYKTDVYCSVLEDNKGMLSFTVRSDDPNIQIDNVQGSLFNLSESVFIQQEINKRLNTLKKQQAIENDKRFSIGIQAGYGVMLQSVNANMPHAVYGPYVGLGLSYTLFRF